MWLRAFAARGGYDTRYADARPWLYGIARNVLSTRLERLVEAGILRRSLYEERPKRYEYRLTKKGTDLWPVLMAMLQWGDRYEAPRTRWARSVPPAKFSGFQR